METCKEPARRPPPSPRGSTSSKFCNSKLVPGEAAALRVRKFNVVSTCLVQGHCAGASFAGWHREAPAWCHCCPVPLSYFASLQPRVLLQMLVQGPHLDTSLVDGVVLPLGCIRACTNEFIGIVQVAVATQILCHTALLPGSCKCPGYCCLSQTCW